MKNKVDRFQAKLSKTSKIGAVSYNRKNVYEIDRRRIRQNRCQCHETVFFSYPVVK